jgi:hypothetical protein
MLTGNLISRSIIKYIHIFVWLLEWGKNPTFVTALCFISPLSGPGNNPCCNNPNFSDANTETETIHVLSER